MSRFDVTPSTCERTGTSFCIINAVTSARTDEWYVERRGRHVLRNEQHKHRERQQDRHAQGDFFTALGRHPEAHQAKARQHDARYDDVIGVVERATPNVQDECDVRIWLRTATANQSHCE